MRKSLWRKIDKHAAALDGHGVIIDERFGKIYRLAVTHDGWCRVCINNFDVEGNTVKGACVKAEDYETPEEAIKRFENLKQHPRLTWREDDRVFYNPKG